MCNVMQCGMPRCKLCRCMDHQTHPLANRRHLLIISSCNHPPSHCSKSFPIPPHTRSQPYYIRVILSLQVNSMVVFRLVNRAMSFNHISQPPASQPTSQSPTQCPSPPNSFSVLHQYSSAPTNDLVLQPTSQSPNQFCCWYLLFTVWWVAGWRLQVRILDRDRDV